ncbi:MAG: type I-B CRISPR-associated protein Cas7/Csh2 [Fervidobacterium sp.]|uniref:type I-B CRISPR-associated protein Cas7/Csh2 n=1 Tax=Fervidobacterium sp. TaxID=1871331 RepID=UPI00404B2EA6
MSNIVLRNSEILFLYDALMTNPNGDPDDENRPRFDYDTQRALVSDVRLKRYIRDYWIAQGKSVFVSKEEGKSVDATKKIDDLLEKINENEKPADVIKKAFIDIRHFGATIPYKAEGKDKNKVKDIPQSITGAIQFAWGYSLHPTEILSSSTITSVLSGRESKQDYGTMGKDWRLKYALIGFYGLVSAWRAKETLLTEEDVEEFDKTVIKSLQLMATTRSKIDQKPRLYLRIEWKDNETFIGDIRDYVNVEITSNSTPASIKDLVVDFEPLSNLLEEKKSRIQKIKLFMDTEIQKVIKNWNIPEDVTQEIITL